MKIFVGTSGWSYDWNPDGFDWYIKNSRLNSVELNASFYRFPFRNQIKSWNKKGNIIWSIKVNKTITHLYKLSEKSYNIWEKFYNLFNEMENKIRFYLFQMPPNFKKLENIEKFLDKYRINNKFAIEFRNKDLLNKNIEKWAKELDITLVSIDSPLGKYIFNSNGIIYIRFHGREDWYLYEYSEEELEEIAKEIIDLNPEEIYVYFNNDHDMLNNARKFLEILNNLY
jgi:uncharacterized protein YecE (DUF72 family)